MTRTERNKAKYENKIYISMDGFEYTVKEYRRYDDITIKFLESGFERNTSMYHILSGKVKSPFYKKPNVPLVFRDNKCKYEGCKYFIDGIMYEILEFNSYTNIIYKCHDEFGYVGHCSYSNIANRQFYNPFKRNACGCYIGDELTYRNDPKFLPVLKLWHGLIERCTGKNFTYDHTDKLRFATKRSRLCKQWMCYSNFAAWYVAQSSILNPDANYHIDKDLLYNFYKYQTGVIKLYSPITCELLPVDINEALFNPEDEVHTEIAKNIVDRAEYYKSIGAITPRAYETIQILYNGKPGYINIDASQYLEWAPRLDNADEYLQYFPIPECRM